MTSPSPLERLAGSGGVLAKEPPDAKEFAGLVRSGLARLKDAENKANSLDSRFDLAYSAAPVAPTGTARVAVEQTSVNFGRPLKFSVVALGREGGRGRHHRY